MNEMGEYLDTQLKTLTPNVWHEEIPQSVDEDVSVVYKFPNSVTLEAREDFLVEVDVWCKGVNAVPAITLANQISVLLDNKKLFINNQAFRFRKLAQREIPEPEDLLFRRQVEFSCKIVRGKTV